MTSRLWIGFGLLAALALAYVGLFTEWLRPAPIGIASQVRFAVQPPRFGRPIKVIPMVIKRESTNRVEMIPKAQQPQARQHGKEVELVGAPVKGTIDQAPGGAANVTFSLDAWYELTEIRVEDVPVDGTAPKVMWRLAGKSAPLDSLLYGRDPVGMKPLLAGPAQPLVPGAPYRLIVEAGRRRGTNNFTTVPLSPAE